MIKIEFTTSEFEFSHGRKPKGRGSWAFEAPTWEGPKFYPSSTYAEARKAVIADVRKLAPADASATVFVNVCP
jgi:hypothetical protein